MPVAVRVNSVRSVSQHTSSFIKAAPSSRGMPANENRDQHKQQEQQDDDDEEEEEEQGGSDNSDVNHMTSSVKHTQAVAPPPPPAAAAKVSSLLLCTCVCIARVTLSEGGKVSRG